MELEKDVYVMLLLFSVHKRSSNISLQKFYKFEAFRSMLKIMYVEWMLIYYRLMN